MSQSPGAPFKKASFRLPLRAQITGLLVLFIGAVVALFYSTTSNYFSRDKISTVRELQTLQVSETARELNDRFSSARAELREAGLKLLDPARGKLSLRPEVWSWVRVRDQTWKGDASTTVLWSNAAQDQLSSQRRFHVEVDADPRFLLMKEPLRVVEAGKETSIWIVGRIFRKALLGNPDALDRGPIRMVLVDLKAAATAANSSLVWLGSPVSTERFRGIFPSMPGALRAQLLQPSPAISRAFEEPNEKTEYIVSRAVVALSESESLLGVVAFASRDEILQGYRRTIAEQLFYAFVIVGFGVLVATLMGRRLSSPIERMVGATRQIETGDFSVRVDASRGDELGDLASAFNHMGEALDSRERALKAAQSALVQNEKLAALGTLSAGIAHEVKNPLAGILGHADMSLGALKTVDFPGKENVFRHLETIQKETKRCRGIIDSLMRFSRQEKAEMAKVDLELVAWEAIHLVEHTLNLSKVVVEKKFDDLAHLIEGNANQIEQVLLNMLQNAGHAMPDGGSITVSTQFVEDPKLHPPGAFVAFTSERFSGPFMRLSVRDTGIGMSEEVQRKIFEPFFTTKPAGVGTGLGLSVTMGILGDHGARVSLDSAPGKGTCFLMDFCAKETRSADILKEVEEVRSRKSGGAKIATDVTTMRPEAQVAKTPAALRHGYSKIPPPPGKVSKESSLRETQVEDPRVTVSSDRGMERAMPSPSGISPVPTPPQSFSEGSSGALPVPPELPSVEPRKSFSESGTNTRSGVFSVRKPKIQSGGGA